MDTVVTSDTEQYARSHRTSTRKLVSSIAELEEEGGVSWGREGGVSWGEGEGVVGERGFFGKGEGVLGERRGGSWGPEQDTRGGRDPLNVKRVLREAGGLTHGAKMNRLRLVPWSLVWGNFKCRSLRGFL